MSLESEPEDWLRRALAVARSVVYAVTNPYYRGAATGAAMAAVTLGLLLVFVPGSVRPHSAGAALAGPRAHQARNGAAASSHPGQHQPGHAAGAAASGRASAEGRTPSPESTAWLYIYPSGQPSPLSSPSPEPTPSPSSSRLSLPSQPLPSPSSRQSLPSQPLPSPAPTQSLPAFSPSP
jgi:hypothetical protein